MICLIKLSEDGKNVKVFKKSNVALKDVDKQCGAYPQPNWEVIPCDPSRPIMERTARLVWVWMTSCFFLAVVEL